MSYILDALRKAEAERERGNVPNIHAQPAFAGARPGAAPVRSRAWVIVLVLAVLLVCLVAAVVYLLFGRNAASDAVTAAKPAAQTTPAVPVAVPAFTPSPAPAPAPAPVPAPVATAQVPAAPPAVTPAPANVTAPVATAPAPVRKPRAVPAAPASAAASAPVAEERIYAIAELPDNIRQQLPTLSVGGSMYSTAAANRLVIINGQVLHEGERITPELTVQQIRQKSAVLVFKGYRYTLPF